MPIRKFAPAIAATALAGVFTSLPAGAMQVVPTQIDKPASTASVQLAQYYEGKRYYGDPYYQDPYRNAQPNYYQAPYNAQQYAPRYRPPPPPTYNSGYRGYERRWAPGTESRERAETRDLNLDQAYQAEEQARDAYEYNQYYNGGYGYR